MGTDVSRSAYPGLVVPDPRWRYADSFDATNSSLTQAGPIPGIPEPQGDTAAVLESSGTMAAGLSLRVRSVRGGTPELGGASGAWRYEGDTGWRGWNPPTIATGWECLDFTTTASQWLYPHAVRLAGEIVLVACQKAGTTLTVWRRTLAGAWSEVTVATHGTYTYGGHPCLVVMPSGRVVLYAWWEDGAANNVRAYYSDDDGATWSLGSRGVLPADVTTGGGVTPRRLRAAHRAGQVLLVAGLTDTGTTYDHILRQYASSDGGNTFALVETWTGTTTDTHAAFHDVVATADRFVVGYLRYTGATVSPMVRRVSNAYTALSSAEAVGAYGTTAFAWGTNTAGVPDYTATGGDYAMALDEDGAIYALGRDHGGAGTYRECVTIRSTDGGATWTAMGTSSAASGNATWWNHRDTTTYPMGFCAVAQSGRLLVPHVTTADGTTTDPSLSVVYLGGYSTVTMPGSQLSAYADKRASWERTWWAMTTPDAAGSIWSTASSSGASTVSLTQTGLRVEGGVGDAQVYENSPTSTFAQGLAADLDVKVDGGTAFLALRLGAAGPTTYSVRVAVSGTAIVLRDLEAGADIATVTTTAGASGVQIRLAVGDDKCAAWYRAAGSVQGSDHNWIAIGSSTNLTDAGSGTTNRIQWGTLSGSGTDCRFRLAHFHMGAYTGTASERLANGQSNPADLLGREFGPGSVHLDGGTRVRMLRGPAQRGDIWNIDTDYLYPVRNLWPEVAPSPDAGLRTTGTAQTDIVWIVDPETEEASQLLGPLRALVILGANWRTGQIDVQSGAGTWSTAVSLDLALQTSINYLRAGSVVTVDTGASTTSAGYFADHELAGGTFKASGGSPAYRRIQTNRGGALTNSTTQRARLVLEAADAADPSSGSAGELWSPCCVAIWPSTTDVKRIRLRIASQTTADGDLRIGQLLFGTFVPFGHRYSRGRVITTTPNTEVTTTRGGQRRSAVLGKARRTVDVAWTEGVDVSQTRASTPTPDYVLPYTGATEPMAAPSETPEMLAGLVARLNGAASLVAYVGRHTLPGSATATQYLRPSRVVYGRITSPVRTEHVAGREEFTSPGEVLTVSTFGIEEEV